MSRESHEEIVVCDGDDDEQVSSTVHLSEPASVFRHIQLLSDQISLLRKDIDVQRAGFEEAIAKSSRDLSELHSMVKQLSEHVSQLQPDQGIDTGLENRVAALEEKEASSKELSSHQRSQLADMKQKVLSLNDACENNVQQLAQLQRSSQNRESRTTGSAEGTGSGQLLLESKAEELERGMSTLKVSAMCMYTCACKSDKTFIITLLKYHLHSLAKCSLEGGGVSPQIPLGIPPV